MRASRDGCFVNDFFSTHFGHVNSSMGFASVQYVCTSFPHPGTSQVSTFHGLHASAAVDRPCPRSRRATRTAGGAASAAAASGRRSWSCRGKTPRPRTSPGRGGARRCRLSSRRRRPLSDDIRASWCRPRVACGVRQMPPRARARPLVRQISLPNRTVSFRLQFHPAGLSEECAIDVRECACPRLLT